MSVYWLNMNRHKRAQKGTGVAQKWHKYGVSNLDTKWAQNWHKRAQTSTEWHKQAQKKQVLFRSLPSSTFYRIQPEGATLLSCCSSRRKEEGARGGSISQPLPPSIVTLWIAGLQRRGQATVINSKICCMCVSVRWQQCDIWHSMVCCTQIA
jgi:hypothetical protein